MRASLRFSLEGSSTDRLLAYQVVDRALHSELELPHLSDWKVRAESAPRASAFAAVEGPAREIFSGQGFVGGCDRQLRCERAGGVATLTITALGTYQLDPNTRSIRLLPPFPDALAVEQALYGPCLSLMLAHSGDYLLHASAVRTATGMVALTGRSGAGKTTLAKELAARTEAVRFADDALAVRPDGEAIVVPGAYPQPKWPRWGAARRHDPPTRLAAVVELVPDGTDSNLERLPASDALLATLTHTVAARLFDPDLLQRHFRFGHELAVRVPWWRLRYRPQLRNLAFMVDQVSELWSR